MKKLYETNDEVELQMLIGILDSQGITAQVQTDGAGDYFRVIGSDYNLYKRVLVKEEDWQKALDIAKSNGFVKQKKPTKQNNTQVWIARIALIIFLAVTLGNIFISLFSYL